MSKQCELCGRALAEKQIVPYWWPHEIVCKRRSCREAVKDAVTAIRQSREKTEPLATAIANRHDALPAPSHGWRQDSMAEIHLNEEWWATEIVSKV